MPSYQEQILIFRMLHDAPWEPVSAPKGMRLAVQYLKRRGVKLWLLITLEAHLRLLGLRA